MSNGSSGPRERRGSTWNVLVVDDHPVVRHGVSCLLEQEPDMRVAGTAGDVRAALSLASKSRPDAAIVDLSLAGRTSLDLIRDLKTRYPRMAVLVLSMHPENVWAHRALRAGASGYVMKSEPPATLVAALRKVMTGEVALSEAVSSCLLQGLVGAGKTDGRLGVERLTPRELDVLRQIGLGYSTSEIADRMCLSSKTVETHRARIKEKLGIENAKELVRFAIEWVKTE